MKADTFHQQIRSGKIPPVCLLYGEETLLIEETLDLMRQTLFGDTDVSLEQEIFYGGDGDAGTILQAARTLPLFGGKKLIVVKEVERMPEAQKQRFLEYIQEPLPNVTLVLTAGRVDRRKRFFAHLQKQWPSIRFYHPYGFKETEAWMRATLRKRGFRIDPVAAERLFEAHGRELQVLKSELEKLTLFMGQPGTIGLSEVSEVSGQSQEFNAFELADAVGERNLERALRIFSRLMEEGVPPLMILGALSAKFRKLWVGKRLERDGCRGADLLRELKIHYRGDQFLGQLRRFREEELERFYPFLLILDELVKGGSSRPAVWMEMMICRICRVPSGTGREAVHLAGQV
jgi:DNA polymerase-3 subunit delta